MAISSVPQTADGGKEKMPTHGNRRHSGQRGEKGESDSQVAFTSCLTLLCFPCRKTSYPTRRQPNLFLHLCSKFLPCIIGRSTFSFLFPLRFRFVFTHPSLHFSLVVQYVMYTEYLYDRNMAQECGIA